MVHRAVFLTGTLAYASAPLWLLFLLLSTALLAKHELVPPEYFTQPYQLFPTYSSGIPRRRWRCSRPRRRCCSCPAGERAAADAAGAPVRRPAGAAGQRPGGKWCCQPCWRRCACCSMPFVLAAYVGWGISWKSPPREDAQTGWGEALRRHGGHTLVGWPGERWCTGSIRPSSGGCCPSSARWVVGAASVFLSRVSLGRALRRANLFVIPEECERAARDAGHAAFRRIRARQPGLHRCGGRSRDQRVVCATGSSGACNPKPRAPAQ